MTDRKWMGVHIYYHGQQDQLLRDGIWPLLDELLVAGLIDRYFFIRHWQGGPHIRLRVQTTGRADIREHVQRHLAGYLCSNGSTLHMEASEYVPLASSLAAIEGDGTGIAPLRPNNSVEFAPYRPDPCWHGMEVEQHFMNSSRIAVELLSTEAEVGQRHGQALTLMVVGAATQVRSESLASFFETTSNGWATTVFRAQRSRYEAEFALQYARQRERVSGLVCALLEAVYSDTIPDAPVPLRRWADSLTRLAATDRTLAHCMHLHNNRLGVTVKQEAFLLFMICQALRDTAGVRR